MKIKFEIVLILFIMVVFLLFCGCTSQNNKSSEKEFVPFSYPPADIEKVNYIIPMGRMRGEHVAPVDHQYYVASYSVEEEADKIVEVYSPGNGVITSIQYMEYKFNEYETDEDYRIVIEHSTSVSSIFIHIDELASVIAEFAPETFDYKKVEIPVDAGEIIGFYRGWLDYSVVDEDVELAFINPDSYIWEPWKIHTPDPFNYFNEEIKTDLIDLCLRTVEPLGGKIDYDIDGRLVGTWFDENYNDEIQWELGCISIAYDNINPDHIIISFGSYDGNPSQFGVKNNSPDPADVNVDSGIIKYELVNFDYYNGTDVWDGKFFEKNLDTKNDDLVQGVVLFKLIENERLKVEIFPGKTSEEIDGFSDDFYIYKR